MRFILSVADFAMLTTGVLIFLTPCACRKYRFGTSTCLCEGVTNRYLMTLNDSFTVNFSRVSAEWLPKTGTQRQNGAEFSLNNESLLSFSCCKSFFRCPKCPFFSKSYQSGTLHITQCRIWRLFLSTGAFYTSRHESYIPKSQNVFKISFREFLLQRSPLAPLSP